LKCEGWFHCEVIDVDEWHCLDISVIITFERCGNTADHEAELRGSRRVALNRELLKPERMVPRS
jgi:hypothetical protein